jgi:predicted transcriptional regulator
MKLWEVYPLSLSNRVKEMKNREKVEKTMEQEIGITFTELKRKTSLENGVLSYHIQESPLLDKRRGAVVHRERCMECPLRGFCQEICVFKLLENDLRRQILEYRSEGVKNSDIARELDVHRSTVSYHVSRLEKNDLMCEEAVRLLRCEDVL